MSSYSMIELACLAMPFSPLCNRMERSAFNLGPEEVLMTTPFMDLIRFIPDRPKPALLLVVPMSGHYETLCRDVIRRFQQTHDVHVIGLKCASEVPVQAGDFGLDDNIETIMKCLRMAPKADAVCLSQGCVSALAAIGLMAAAGEELPRTLTLLGGPIDVRQGPTLTSQIVESIPMVWFQSNICEVPESHPGRGREVWPAFMQHSMFLRDKPIRLQDCESQDALDTFYAEYHTVMDLPARYFLEVIQAVYHDHALPSGTLRVRGEKVDLGAIRGMPLLTVEGSFDSTVGVGQTSAAHDLCVGLAATEKLSIVLPVNHYMIYGHPWERLVAPAVLDFIQSATQR
jgi:poly(3-hydroxybutyrate) depolymerase